MIDDDRCCMLAKTHCQGTHEMYSRSYKLIPQMTQQNLQMQRTITGLNPGNEYTCKVKACNSHGCGLYSPTASFQTLEIAPYAVSKARASRVHTHTHLSTSESHSRAMFTCWADC